MNIDHPAESFHTRPVAKSNKGRLFLALLQSVESAGPLSVNEFLELSVPDRSPQKTRSWYWRWLRQMRDGTIITSANETLDQELVRYANQRLTQFGEGHIAAIDRRLSEKGGR